MKSLMTQRLLLRPWEERDAADMYAYAKNPRVGPRAGWKPHESPEESLAVIHQFQDAEDVWAICLRATGKAIGSVSLEQDGQRNLSVDDCRSLGYVLSEDFWGQGLMPEACQAVLQYGFEQLGLRLISVNHYPENLQSKRVIEKLGFQYNGTLVWASQIYDGTFKDLCCYSMTAAQYEGRREDKKE